jgi:hypothetical protein
MPNASLTLTVNIGELKATIILLIGTGMKAAAGYPRAMDLKISLVLHPLNNQ